MLRLGATAAAVIVLFLAGCPEDASSPGGESRVEWRSGADQGGAALVDTDDLLVRVACRSYDTDTGPYLSLGARTRSDDASARVRFEAGHDPHFGEHRFAQADLDRSYGRWDLLGATPGDVRGHFVYRPAGGERIAFDFTGSGGRADGQCDLRGEVATGPPGDPLRVVEAPPSGRYAPEPVGLAPGAGLLDTCELGAQGGGYDVWIKDISCRSTRRWILRLHATYGALPAARDEGVGRVEGGWECWSRLEARYGPIHNVCVRGSQLIMFYFA